MIFFGGLLNYYIAPQNVPCEATFRKNTLENWGIGKHDEKSFFYSDIYNGKDVNIEYYCTDFIGLYYILKK